MWRTKFHSHLKNISWNHFSLSKDSTFGKSWFHIIFAKKCESEIFKFPHSISEMPSIDSKLLHFTNFLAAADFSFLCGVQFLFRHIFVLPFVDRPFFFFTVWKNEKFTHYEKLFRQINTLIISLIVKSCFHKFFVKKGLKSIFP